MSELKIKGRIFQIGDREQKTATFTVRKFAIETDSQYPQKVQLQLVNDRCDLIDGVKIGEQVTVSFDIRWNEHDGKIYNNLNAWKIERSVTSVTQPPPKHIPLATVDDGFPDDGDSLPF